MSSGGRIEEWASRYVGLLYVRHGRDIERDGGLDCWGLTRFIFKEEFNIDLPAYDALYTDEAEVDEVLQIAAGENLYRPVQIEYVRAGDVVLFSSLRDVLHTAVMVNRAAFIHCNSHSTFSTIERIDDKSWKPRILGFWRHKHLEDRCHQN